ncbi:MAG: hypothetical protein ACLF0P_06920 [Thermoanaerobaculia bacterium]
MAPKTPRGRRGLEQEVQSLESQLRDAPEAEEEASKGEAGPDEDSPRQGSGRPEEREAGTSGADDDPPERSSER